MCKMAIPVIDIFERKAYEDAVNNKPPTMPEYWEYMHHYNLYILQLRQQNKEDESGR